MGSTGATSEGMPDATHDMTRRAARSFRSRSRSGVLVGVAAGGLALFVGSIALAFIPQADRVLQAVAELNRSSGRTQGIQLDLTMRVGDRPPVAQGELVSHPSGLARLELKGFSGRLERYLLVGRELTASRDGQPLERPRPLLQPFFLLQADSGTTLRVALETFGVLHDVIGLAPCGDDDCFVIGDPRLAAPLPPPETGETGIEAGPGRLGDVLVDPLDELRGVPGDADPEAGEDDLEGPTLGLPEGAGTAGNGTGARGDDPALQPAESLPPRLWLTVEDLEVRRIDRATGEFMILGPMVSFERLQVPAWLEIHEPGSEPIRFEVDRALSVNAVPQAFSRSWLMAPPPRPPGSEVGEGGEAAQEESPVGGGTGARP